MGFRVEAVGNPQGNYTIPVQCGHCKASNYVADNKNFWKCWNCGTDLKF